MPRPYPDANFTSISGLWTHTDTVMGGWWGALVMMGLSVVIFVIMEKRGYSTSQSLLLSFLLALILGVMLWSGGFLPGNIMVIWLLFTVLSSVYAIFDR